MDQKKFSTARWKRPKWAAIIFAAIFLIGAIPEFYKTNKGESRSLGSVRDGGLENGWLVPFSGKNFRYFSQLSYYLFDNGYTHSKTWRTIIDAYRTCETTCPGTQFRLMECSDKSGGRLMIHRTHQNGTSADFMVPKKRGGSQSTFFDHLGYFHYLIDFDEKGRLFGAKSVEIDFEAVARHILAIDEAAKANGLKIRKIIFRLELMNELLATPSGKLVAERGIYFAQRLPYWTNRVHDDHYHIDFVNAE